MNNPSSLFHHKETVSKHTVSPSGNYAGLRTWRSSDRQPGGTNNPPTGLLTLKFWGHENIMFWLTNQEYSHQLVNFWVHVTGNRIHNFCIIEWFMGPLVPECCILDSDSEILLNIEVTDYRSNFVKTILFEYNSCFSKIPFCISVESPRIFQCLISIPADHWVRRIDGDLPRRFFVSFTQLVISKTGRFWTIRKSAAQWRRNRARGYKKSILRANLLYFPIVKM